MFKKILSLAVLATAILLTGCASVPTASPELDKQAKKFNTSPDKATVYIYRNESMGAAIKMDVMVDGRTIGQTAAKTYFALAVPPGKHTVVSKAENDSAVVLDTQAGKNYYVWQEVKMGVMYARNQLQVVDEAKGKAGVMECSLIEPTTAAFALNAPPAPARAAAAPGPAVSASTQKVPYLSSRGQERFQEFLKRPLPRAFAISDNGYSAVAFGTKPKNPEDPADPKERALKICKQYANKDCQLYMVDNDIVFKQ